MNRMLRTIIDVLAMIIFCCAVLYFFSTFDVGMKYTKTGYIKCIHGDKVCVIDEDGEEWEFYGNDFEQGQKVTITLHNNGTNHTDDDRIIGIEIS